MGLGFLVPAFLAGFTALLVPIVFHLRHRERDKPLRFPSLMFLRRIPIRTAQRRRITDWFLLLLRAFAVALLVAAFARPFVGRAAVETTAEPARAVLLLLDRSLSMGHREVWPAALDSARRVVAGLGGNDRIAVVLFDDAAEVAQPLTADRALAIAAIDGARPTARGTRYASALRAARQLAAEARGFRTEVVVVTDMQRSGLAGLAGMELPADLEVRGINLATAKRPNAAVVGADVQRLPDGERSRLLVSARLTSRDQAAAGKARVRLTVNGRLSGTRDFTLPSDGAVAVAFDPVPLAAGRARAMITLEPDGLAADDTLRFVVPAEEALRVAVVAPADAGPEEMLFLERALGIGRAPRFGMERRAAGSLSRSGLRAVSAVVLFDVPVPAGPAGNALTEWVKAGGGVVMAAGRRVASRGSASPLMPGDVRGLAERMDDRGGVVGEVSPDHPIFTPFAGNGAAILGAARFLRYPKVTTDSGAVVLARFDDGLPLLVEQAVGAGHSLLLAAPLDAVAGDFPLQPAFLPFLRRLILHVAGYEPPPPWRIAGETSSIPDGLKEPVVATPGGTLLRLPADSANRTVALREAGFYDIYEGRAAGEPVWSVAVNPPAPESDLTPADARELLLGVRRGDSTTSAGSAPPVPAEREGRQRLWRLLLAAAVVLLIAEMIVANRGWRGTASPILPAAPQRSAP